ncbi:MAG: hypothetical protein ACRDQ5_10990 [Sciscionella sp.]
MEDDLSDIAYNVRKRRRTAHAGRRLANDPLTRAYLEAGMRILEQEFFEENIAEDNMRRPLSTLTREAVLAEAANGSDPLPIRPGEGSLRDRWEYFSDYIGDLVRYALRGSYWIPHLELAESSVQLLHRSDVSFSAIVHEVAYQSAALGVDSTASRFRFLVTAMADQNPTVQEALAGVYAKSTNRWKIAYSAILADRGIKLRPGISLDEITMILTAVAEGLGLRMVGDPSAPILDHHHRRALLGQAAVAIFAACVDAGDGKHIDQVVDSLSGRVGDRSIS